jgi:carboxy-terminal domain RNA polymerase II polypeptide A small phosphatase
MHARACDMAQQQKEQAARPPAVTMSIIHQVEEDDVGSPRVKTADGAGATSLPPGSPSMSSSLRRIFSPPIAKSQAQGQSQQTQQQLGAAARRDQAQNARKRFFARLCACLSPQPANNDANPPLDLIFQQIAELEPTYEPTAPLLQAVKPEMSDKVCLVLDLDETLVHSSFTPIDGADFEIPLNMQGETHTVFVKKRPGVDHFLAVVAEWFEVVVFTASLALYANPVMDLLDPNRVVHERLYREHCVLIGGCYVKDIAKLGRDLKRTLIIDNSPLSYALQPENSIPIDGFFTDEADRELERVLGLLEKAKTLPDVRKFAD